MDTNNIDKYLDSKLRKSETVKTSDNFTRLLMGKIQSEYSFEAEIRKTDRAANYIIGFFVSLLVFISGLAGYFYLSSQPVEAARFNESMSFYQRFTDLIEVASLQAAGFFSGAANYLGIFMMLVFLSSMYFLADQFFVGHRSRSK